MTNDSAVSQPVSQYGVLHRPTWRTPIGIGLLVGAVALVLVTWSFGDPGGLPVNAGEFGEAHFAPPLVVVLIWVFIPAWTALLAYLEWRARRTGSPAAGSGRRVGAVRLAGLGCLAVLLVLLSVSGLYRAGPLGDQSSLTLIAGVAATAGTFMVGRDAEVDLRTWRARGYIAGGVAVVAVAAGSVASLLSEVKHVDATTAEPGIAAPLPTSHLTEKWRWRARTEVHGVVPAGTGAVVATGYGITALDGATGAERWHYQRNDLDHVYQVVALDQGRTVIVTLRLGTGDEHIDQHRAFDAFTGRELWQYTSATYTDRTPPLSSEPTVSATTLISRDDQEAPHAARDSRTGDVLWRWAPPPECPDTGSRLQATADVVLVPLECGTDHAVLALDPRTGVELWRQDNTALASSNGTIILVDPDSSSDRGRFVDARTGRETGPNPGFTEPYADPNSPAVAGELGYPQGTKLGLFQPGEGLRWAVGGSQSDMALVQKGRQALAFLPDSIALVNQEFGDHRSRERLVLLDRDTGAVLRELRSTPWYDVERSAVDDEELSVVAAPGTLIAVSSTDSFGPPPELIGFG